MSALSVSRLEIQLPLKNKCSVLSIGLDGYSPNTAFLLLMLPSMWGHLDSISNKEKNKKKGIAFYESVDAADVLCLLARKRKKKEKNQKNKSERMDWLFNCKQWLVPN